jgi:hypothetical protein
MTPNEESGTRTHSPIVTSHLPLSHYMWCLAIDAAFIGNNGSNQRKTP